MATIPMVDHPVSLGDRDYKAHKPAIKDVASESAHEQTPGSYTSHKSLNNRLSEDYIELEDQVLIEEATVMDPSGSSKQNSTIEPPALPQKSRLRASRFLENFKLEDFETAPQSFVPPHDVYLSSEEDASSSADDFSDYDFDSSTEDYEDSPVQRRSHEVTARVVSVIFSGKPNIIDLSSPRTSTSRLAMRRPQTICLQAMATDSDSNDYPPPRKSSLCTEAVPRTRPAFLNIDPYATRSSSFVTAPEEPEEAAELNRPKTPTALFKRTLGHLVHKRSKNTLSNLRTPPSRESLSSIYSQSATDLSSTRTTTSEESAERNYTMSPSETSPVTYKDIIKTAKRKTTLTSPVTSSPSSTTSPVSAPASRRSILGGLGMNKRKSMKI